MELSTVVGCSIWTKRQSGKIKCCSERTEKSVIVYWLSWVKNRNYLELLAAPDGCGLHSSMSLRYKNDFFLILFLFFSHKQSLLLGEVPRNELFYRISQLSSCTLSRDARLTADSTMRINFGERLCPLPTAGPPFPEWFQSPTSGSRLLGTVLLLF